MPYALWMSKSQYVTCPTRKRGTGPEIDKVALNESEGEAIAALHAYLKPGEDDIEVGRVIDHEAFMREMKDRYRSRDAA